MSREHLRLCVVVLALVLAGCAGGSGTTTLQDTTGTAQQSTATTTGPDADAVVGSTVRAIGSVERYRLEGTIDQTLRSNAITRNVTIESAALVARDARRSYATVTQTAQGQSVEIERYIADGWVYEHQAAYAREYGSAWIKQSVAENVSVTWRNNEELGIVRAILENGTARLTGTETLDRRETRVLAVEANGTALETYLLGRNLSSLALSNVTARVWVDTETGRPLRVVRELDKTQTAKGRTIRYDLTVTVRFAYGVDDRVEVPPPARNATSIANATGTG